MRKYILMALCACLCTIAKAQSLELGLRDNQYAHASFIGKNRWLIGYEQSVLNVKAKEQSGRLFVGYIYERSSWSVTGIAYGGTEYAWNWQAYGAIAKGEFTKKRLGIGGTLNANYDTYFDFQMNYDINVKYAIVQKYASEHGKQQLDVCASFGNIPEYRENVKNLRIGLKFTSGNLWVQPDVCIPNIEKGSSKHIRMLCSLGWNLEIK